MAQGIQQGTQGGHIGAHGTGRVDMGDQNRADRMGFVGAQGRLDAGHVDGGGPEIDQLHRHTHGGGRVGPGQAEAARGQHQRAVAARKQVGIGRFPAGMAIADIHGDMARGAGDLAQVGPDRVDHVVQRAGIDVGRAAVHGLKHPVRHGGRPGNGKIGASVGKGHDRNS